MDRISGSASTTLFLCMESLRRVSNGSIIQTDTAIFSRDMMFKYMSDV